MTGGNKNFSLTPKASKEKKFFFLTLSISYNAAWSNVSELLVLLLSNEH